MTSEQIASIRQNYDALTSWIKDFDRQRSAWGYPQGIEQRLGDQFDLISRVTASLLGLLRDLGAENGDSHDH